ncbi:cytidine deaminase [Guggenheimella bovis]
MNEKAFEFAKKVRQKAYVPYSDFHVGCVVVTENGMYEGCNIENASYGATICAERSALSQAYSKGDTEIKEVYIVADNPFTAPCGICRQVLLELAKKATIYLCDENVCKAYSIEDLLPHSFSKGDLDV